MTKPQASILHLMTCIAGIYICYLSYGIMQEKIFKYRDASAGRFTSTLFLLCIQCATNTVIAFLATLYWKPVNSAMPASPFAFTAFSYLGAMLCSNEALKHVAYPTQALAKSCKMIPVMLMGVLLRGKKYSVKEYLCVLTITVGIALFQLGKLQPKNDAKENSSYGLALLFLSLALDGITGPKQEILCQTYQPSVHQQMMLTNVWATMYTLAGCLLTGQGQEGFWYILANPALITPLVAFAICSALGQNFIFFTIQRFSALTCTTITTTRKFFTILVSVAIFGHTLTSMSWTGVILVFSGLTVELVSKYQKHQKSV